MDCILAVDAGNSKTIALVAALDGTIIGAGRGGAGDITGGAEAAFAHIEYAIVTALKAAGKTAADLNCAAFSMAGADWTEDARRIRKEMRRCGFDAGGNITVVNDAIGALAAGASQNWGVSIACGTWSNTAARNACGQAWVASYWQEEGGAFGM